MNTAYKHLDSKLRIAELTIGQWMGIFLGVGLAIAWGMYVSPFGPTVSLTSAVYVGAIPAGAALLGSTTEIDPVLMLRSAIAWRRSEGRFLPGPGHSASGYVVTGDSHRETERRRREAAPPPSLAALWEEAQA
jgi:hypothetical protein